MFTIRAPNRAHNGITAGVRFTAGVGETDNPAALAYFSKAGYTILPAGTAVPEPAADVPRETVAEAAPMAELVPDALEGLTKKQLVALAAERGVEVDPKSSNAVLRDALIAAALAEEEANSVPMPDGQATDEGANPFAPGKEG